jgi:hypothetical protein
LQDLLKKLQEDSSLPYDFAEGTLYLDPDIIDLTLIPPPITPDEVSVCRNWSQFVLEINSGFYSTLSEVPYKDIVNVFLQFILYEIVLKEL